MEVGVAQRRHNPVDSICRKIQTIQRHDRDPNSAFQIPKIQSCSYDSPQSGLRGNVEALLRKRTVRPPHSPEMLTPTSSPKPPSSVGDVTPVNAANTTYTISSTLVDRRWDVGRICSTPAAQTGENYFSFTHWSTSRKSLPQQECATPNVLSYNLSSTTDNYSLMDGELGYSALVVKRLSMGEGTLFPAECKKDTMAEVSLICEEDLLDTIFHACDTQRRGKVYVSRIVDYLRHTTSRSSEDSGLEELCNMLDPEHKDISIDLDTYHAIMKEWIEDCRNQGDSTPEDLTQDSVKLKDSLSVRRSALLNMTSGSLEAFGGEASRGDLETSDLVYCMADLQLNNQKLQDEVRKLKQTIEAMEETNHKLLEENEELKSQARMYLQLSGKEKTLKEEMEEVKGLLNVAEESRAKASAQNKQKEKENQGLISKIASLQEENLKVTMEIDDLQKKMLELCDINTDLQVQIHSFDGTMKEKDSLLQDKSRQIEELKAAVIEYSSVIDVLRADKVKLESHVQMMQPDIQVAGLSLSVAYRLNQTNLGSLQTELALAQEAPESLDCPSSSLCFASPLDETLDREVLLLLQGPAPEQMSLEFKTLIAKLSQEFKEDGFTTLATVKKLLQGTAHHGDCWERSLQAGLEEKRNTWTHCLIRLDQYATSLEKELIKMASNMRRSRTEILHLNVKMQEHEIQKQQLNEELYRVRMMHFNVVDTASQTELDSKGVDVACQTDENICQEYVDADSQTEVENSPQAVDADCQTERDTHLALINTVSENETPLHVVDGNSQTQETKHPEVVDGICTGDEVHLDCVNVDSQVERATRPQRVDAIVQTEEKLFLERVDTSCQTEGKSSPEVVDAHTQTRTDTLMETLDRVSLTQAGAPSEWVQVVQKDVSKWSSPWRKDERQVLGNEDEHQKGEGSLLSDSLATNNEDLSKSLGQSFHEDEDGTETDFYGCLVEKPSEWIGAEKLMSEIPNNPPKFYSVLIDALTLAHSQFRFRVQTLKPAQSWQDFSTVAWCTLQEAGVPSKTRRSCPSSASVQQGSVVIKKGITTFCMADTQEPTQDHPTIRSATPQSVESATLGVMPAQDSLSGGESGTLAQVDETGAPLISSPVDPRLSSLLASQSLRGANNDALTMRNKFKRDLELSQSMEVIEEHRVQEDLSETPEKGEGVLVSEDAISDVSKEDGSGLSQSEKEIENEFHRLSLGFKCDMFTLEKRLRQEQRSRDLAEENTKKEVSDCQWLLQTLVPLCEDDNQCMEIIQRLQKNLDILVQSMIRVSSRSETLGAINQENRVSKAVEVMIQHVENLRRMYTKEHTELMELRETLVQSERSFGSHVERDDFRSKKLPGTQYYKPPSRRVSIAAVPRSAGGNAQYDVNKPGDAEELDADRPIRRGSWKGSAKNSLQPCLKRVASACTWAETDEISLVKGWDVDIHRYECEPDAPPQEEKEDNKEQERRRSSLTELGNKITALIMPVKNTLEQTAPLVELQRNRGLWVPLALLVLLAGALALLASLALQPAVDAALVGPGDSWVTIQQLLWPYTGLRYNGQPPV